MPVNESVQHRAKADIQAQTDRQTDRQTRVGHGLDASMDWIGLDWVECWKNLDGLDWIGLRRINDVILCYRWGEQVCSDY